MQEYAICTSWRALYSIGKPWKALIWVHLSWYIRATPTVLPQKKPLSNIPFIFVYERNPAQRKWSYTNDSMCSSFLTFAVLESSSRFLTEPWQEIHTVASEPYGFHGMCLLDHS